MARLTYDIRDGRALWAGRTLHEWAPDVVRLVVERFDPAKLILFGSVAAGSDGPDSDLDFLVVLDDAPPSERYVLMVELLAATRSVGAPVDLLVTSKEDFEHNCDRVGTLEYEPAHQGLVVYERS